MNLRKLSASRVALCATVTAHLTGCCGDAPRDEQIDRADIAGVYTPHNSLLEVVPANGDANEIPSSATDVTLTVEGSTVTLAFVADGKRHAYTYTMQESFRVVTTLP